MRSQILSILALLWISIGLANGQAWPNGPLVTSSRWIHDSQGKNVTYAGVNWPGAADVMIPEGLQYASISSIVSGIKSLGLNAIRLTFAIEMIDDVYDNGGDKTILAAFQTALGTANGQKVYNQVIAKNPSFNSTTTRLQVYDAIAAECFKQQIYVHLDNHMSKGGWCCSETDGNAWFGDTYFDVTKWKRGLTYMATRGKTWGNLMSIGLRNELRDPSNNAAASATYNWSTWYTNVAAAAKAVNAANPDILIFLSGLNYDTTLSPIPTGASLGSGTVFRKSDFSFANKFVLELHNYQNSATSCSSITNGLVPAGFDALETTNSSIVNVFPVVMTEFGYDQSGNDYNGVYASCLRSYLPSQKAGWMLWVISGSYYIRSGTQDYDETWGLYNHAWSAWRNTNAAAAIKSMAAATLA